MIPNFMYACIRPILFSMDPEKAHHFTLSSMKIADTLKLTALSPSLSESPRPVMGLTFPNPVGLPSGIDTNVSFLSVLSSLVFAFLEFVTFLITQGLSAWV